MPGTEFGRAERGQCHGPYLGTPTDQGRGNRGQQTVGLGGRLLGGHQITGLPSSEDPDEGKPEARQPAPKCPSHTDPPVATRLHSRMRSWSASRRCRFDQCRSGTGQVGRHGGERAAQPVRLKPVKK